MPPPNHSSARNNDRDPLDPFPTLLQSLRTPNSRTTPTYAAVARSPVHENRALPDNHAESSTQARSRGGQGWSIDDVDRSDTLDEIRSFPSSPVYRVSPRPSRVRVEVELPTYAGNPRIGTTRGIRDLIPPRNRTERIPVDRSPARLSTHSVPVPLQRVSERDSRTEIHESQERVLSSRRDTTGAGEETWREGMYAATRYLMGREEPLRTGADYHDDNRQTTHDDELRRVETRLLSLGAALSALEGFASSSLESDPYSALSGADIAAVIGERERLRRRDRGEAPDEPPTSEILDLTERIRNQRDQAAALWDQEMVRAAALNLGEGGGEGSTGDQRRVLPDLEQQLREIDRSVTVAQSLVDAGTRGAIDSSNQRLLTATRDRANAMRARMARATDQSEQLQREINALQERRRARPSDPDGDTEDFGSEGQGRLRRLERSISVDSETDPIALGRPEREGVSIRRRLNAEPMVLDSEQALGDSRTLQRQLFDSSAIDVSSGDRIIRLTREEDESEVDDDAIVPEYLDALFERSLGAGTAARRRRPNTTTGDLPLDPLRILRDLTRNGNSEDNDNDNDDASARDRRRRNEEAQIRYAYPSSRVIRPFYSHPNVSGDVDTSEWQAMFGDADNTLRRGGNNRRRGTVSRPGSVHIPPVRDATETRDVRPLASRREIGLLPTNRESYEAAGDVVDTITSRRRDRDGVEEEYTGPADKRRKVDKDEPKVITRAQYHSHWPSYLSHHPWIKSKPAEKPLPTEFESTSGTFLRVTHSAIGRPIVKFMDHPQLTETDSDACNVGTTIPIPVACGIFYYEAECISDGVKGYMSVGWKSGKRTSKNRLVGWEKGTFGWHSDDGMCFEQSGSGSNFAATWAPGDTVGLGINFTTGQAFFTKNGRFIGHRFRNLGADLRPAVGLRSKGEELCINFNGPFRFDIDSYVADLRKDFESQVSRIEVDRVPRILSHAIDVENNLAGELELMGKVYVDGQQVAETQSQEQGKVFVDGVEVDVNMGESSKTHDAKLDEADVDLPSTSDLREPIAKTSAAFVVDYLRHQGYTSALEKTRKEMERRNWITSESTDSDHDTTLDPIYAKIHRINRELLDVNQPTPLAYISEHVVGNSDLTNRMKVHQFMYLVRMAHANADENDQLMDDIISYGKSLREEIRSPQSMWNEYDKEQLEDAFGYIARPPSEMELRAWDNKRIELAAAVDKEIRTTYNIEADPIIKTALQQVSTFGVVMAAHDPSTTFIDARKYLGLDAATKT